MNEEETEKKKIAPGDCFCKYGFEDDACEKCVVSHKCKDATMDEELEKMITKFGEKKKEN